MNHARLSSFRTIPINASNLLLMHSDVQLLGKAGYQNVQPSHISFKAAQPECCSSSVRGRMVNITGLDSNAPILKEYPWHVHPLIDSTWTHLPAIQLCLFRLVLLQHILQHLLQAIRVGLKRGQNILHCTLDQNTVDHAEAFAVVGKRVQCLDHESVSIQMKSVSVVFKGTPPLFQLCP